MRDRNKEWVRQEIREWLHTHKDVWHDISPARSQDIEVVSARVNCEVAKADMAVKALATLVDMAHQKINVLAAHFNVNVDYVPPKDAHYEVKEKAPDGPAKV